MAGQSFIFKRHYSRVMDAGGAKNSVPDWKEQCVVPLLVNVMNFP